MSNNLSLCSDRPCERDCLGFTSYINAINALIRDEHFETPFCVGVFGKWGSGKTSFMRLLKKNLLKKNLLEKPPPVKIVPVWFNPWRYDREEHLIIPFLKTLEHGIEKNAKGEGFKEIKDSLQKVSMKIGRVAAAFACGMDVKLKLGPAAEIHFDPSKSIKSAEETEKRRREEAAGVLKDFSSLYYDSMSQLKKAVEEKGFRIVVFIDDLDRCLPEKAVELLESMKLFFDIPGYLFVIGVDKEVVERGITWHYRHFENGSKDSTAVSAEDYLEKMIQLPIELPPIEPGKKRDFIQDLLKGQEAYAKHAKLIEKGIGENPRSLKRFVNLLLFTGMLANQLKERLLSENRDKKDSDSKEENLINRYFVPEFYIKWAIILFRFHDVYTKIRGNTGFLWELQNAARNGDAEDPSAAHLDRALKEVLSYGEKFPKDRWVIDHFKHLARVSDAGSKTPGAAPGYRRAMPNIGEMVKIPQGKFLYGDQKEEGKILYDYYIDAFPVTNRQYQAFMDDRQNHPVPGDWDKRKRVFPEGLEDHPVLDVSLEEVVEYCKWRSEKEGVEHRLPTEEEWEKAARGEDGREYPWGNDFDPEKCNSEESGIGQTTPVARYPDGASPYGVYDMAGNVWEWTDRKEGFGYVLRGGSWFRRSVYCRCVVRSLPGGRDDYVTGFRCVRT
ncbi:conserved hypothetical protein [Candidatus Desulfarcum epimagneticum]|uniref:KAP NTPase domain-containing protein n=1 Tax=uncultured Desulfobacteraceae bacterium TaxID=218296 RepID=A0A484HI19_9BACT|nr:conserved hypothetical protein [uncultured Desulfobacteraceae bacterium]